MNVTLEIYCGTCSDQFFFEKDYFHQMERLLKNAKYISEEAKKLIIITLKKFSSFAVIFAFDIEEYFKKLLKKDEIVFDLQPNIERALD